MNIEKAREIADAIIDNLTDRRGLRQEWDNIDEDVQAEIRETWAGIIEQHSREDV